MKTKELEEYIKQVKVTNHRNNYDYGELSFNGNVEFSAKDLQEAVYKLDNNIERLYGVNATFDTEVSKSSMKKDDAFRLCIARQMDRDAASKELASHGLGFNLSRKKDIIILFCLENKIYDLSEINDYLNKYNIKNI